MNEEPSNQDLLHYIKDVQGKVADIKEKDLPEINSRVKVTNGSVAEIVKWKERVTGASWAIGICFTVIVIPLLTWAFITISKIPDKIDDGISQALKNNVKNITNEQ